MKKYKQIFKRNFFLMLLLIIVITTVVVLIKILENNTSNRESIIGGSFSLTDQNQNKFHSQSLKKSKLIYFGYTYCPDVCPFDILKLSKLIDQNPQLKNKLEFIFITVDPERDQPQQLKSFLENFNPSIIGLTGTEEEIQNVVRKFRIYVRKNKNSSNDQNYLVDHSSLFFLLDKNDKYVSHFRPKDFELGAKKLF